VIILEVRKSQNDSPHPKGRTNMSKNAIIKQAKIAKVEATPEKICGRGGLFFFLRYIENIHFYSLLETHFGRFFENRGQRSLALSIYETTAGAFCEWHRLIDD